MTSIRLGMFELLREAGAGGMGTVWEGRHRASGMPVAVKFLDPSRARDHRYAQRFEAEARAIARLRHPRIVQIYDVGLLEAGAIEGFAVQNPYIVMEWIPNSLADLPRPMPWKLARAIVLEVLDALAHVHARDVLHRDVKPANVLGRVGRLRLGDFGIAEVVADDLADTALSGTPYYMAPEQFSTSAGVQGPWTDLYAVGCLTYLLAVGRPPFDGASPVQLAVRHLRDPFPLDGCDDALSEWLGRMTAKRPRDRYQSAANAARDLAAVDSGMTAATSDGDVAMADASTASQTLGMTTILLDGPTLGTMAPAPTTTTPREHGPTTVPNWRFAEALSEHEEQIEGTSIALSLMRYPSVVGREPERDALWERLQDVARNGSHHQVAIVGEHGLGKSRLAGWLRERTHELGAARVAGTLQCGAKKPLLSFVRAELGLEAGMQREVVAGRVELMSDDALDAASRNAIVSWLDGTLDAAAARDRSHAVSAALRLLFGDAPLVIVAEDYERSTPEVRDDVARLFEAGGPRGTLVVMTTQVEPESPDIERLQLEPLDESSVARILRNMAGLSPGLIAKLTARSRGNPGYARNLVGDLVEQRQLVNGPHGLDLRDGAELASTTSDALWCRRLGALITELGGDALAVVEVATAIGEPVERIAWEHVCATAGVSAPDRVDRLLRMRELVRANSEDNAWSFAVDAMRDWTEAEARDAGRWPHWVEACREALPDADVARRARWAFEVGDVTRSGPSLSRSRRRRGATLRLHLR